MHEICAARDLIYLRLGAVATHLGFLEHFLEARILVDAVDDVLEDLLLVFYLRRATQEEAPPQRVYSRHPFFTLRSGAGRFQTTAFLRRSASICSRLRPLVSGTRK
jgi:hypothetical protein